MKKHIRELIGFLERRNIVKVRAAPARRASHPVLICKAGGVTIHKTVPGTPSDLKRNALNVERDLKVKFRARGVELERRP